MGTCASKRPSSSTKDSKKQEENTKMYMYSNDRKLSVTHWPSQSCVDFKNIANSSSKAYTLSLNNQ